MSGGQEWCKKQEKKKTKKIKVYNKKSKAIELINEIIARLEEVKDDYS